MTEEHDSQPAPEERRGDRGRRRPARRRQPHAGARAREPAPLPARQAAALAATGFAAGAVTAAVVTAPPRHAPGPPRKRKKGVVGEIVSSNSFLVDVHLLRRD